MTSPATLPSDVKITCQLNGVPVPLSSLQPPVPTTEDSNQIIMAQIARNRMAPLTPGLAGVSGISDDTAPSATGKLMCALLMGSVREEDLKHLALLALMREAPPNARIYEEKCGTGHTYFRMRYTSKGRRHVRYLGKPSPEMLAWMRAVLEENRLYAAPRYRRRTLDRERVDALRRLFTNAQKHARSIARTAGYRFKGYRLMRVKTC